MTSPGLTDPPRTSHKRHLGDSTPYGGKRSDSIPYEGKQSDSIPTTGMRGGLGRTILTAFLVLAILPLSTITWYATQRERHDIQTEVTAKLTSAATMAETQLRQTVATGTSDLALLAALPATQHIATTLTAPPTSADADAARDQTRAHLHLLIQHNPAFRRLALSDTQGHTLVYAAASPPTYIPGSSSTASHPSLSRDPHPDPANPRLPAISDYLLTQPIVDPHGHTIARLTAWLNLGHLLQSLPHLTGLGNTANIYLVDPNRIAWPQGQTVTSPAIQRAISGESGSGLYHDYTATPVIGVYRWIPDLELALIAEQAQDQAFATNDTVTAAVVGATLAVALVTAVIAAIVTRQITRPIVRLTESALRIADGRLDQHVPVTSRDEMGILAYVFNHMAAELKALYDDLEEKVAQRTALLQKANYHIQRRAIQLATTIEVSQAATSILEPDQLLRQVVGLVHDGFAYSYVGIYLINPGPPNPDHQGTEDVARRGDAPSKLAILQKDTGGNQELAAVKAQPVPVGHPSPVGQAAQTGQPAILRWDAGGTSDQISPSPPSPHIRAEAALPLRIGDHTIGVLDILSTDQQDFDQDDVSVLQNVANQITIALENARAYAVEREAAKQLRQLDRSKRRFLANMSHELRTPLTNIIGYSGLLLKGLDGPLTQQQTNDVETVYHNSQHLLGLINDLLDISHIEAGLMELQFRDVDVADLIRSVSATAGALVRDSDTQLIQDLPPDLPNVQADPARLRQVLLRLMTNAAQRLTHSPSTDHGTITVRSWSTDEHLLVSISDNGLPIPPEDEARIFEQFDPSQPPGVGRQPHVVDGQPQAVARAPSRRTPSRGQSQGTGHQLPASGPLASNQYEGAASLPSILKEKGERSDGVSVGLALSKEFVEMHGGRIWVDSKQGKGTTFTFSLPLSGPPAVPAGNPSNLNGAT